MSLRETILAAIVGAAELGAPCPTNKALGALVCRSATAIHYHLKHLKHAGAIAIVGGTRSRRIIIPATGKATGWTRRCDARQA